MPPALQWVLQNLTRNLGCEVGLAKAIFGAGSFAPSEQALRHKKNIRVNIECARLRALSSPEPAPGGCSALNVGIILESEQPNIQQPTRNVQ